jgi:8-oxo-dGTP diphosphatase
LPVNSARPFAQAAGPDSDGGFAVDVRIVLLTVHDGQLKVASLPDGDGWQLPRGVPLAAMPLDSAARLLLGETIGLQEDYLEQLYTLHADDGHKWIVLISYLAIVASGSGLPQTEATWLDTQSQGFSSVDRMVLDYAIVRLQAKLGYTTIAFHLMPEQFTLPELQDVYETALSMTLDKRNFRRRILASGMLEQLDEKRRDGSHRPAQLYRFRAGHDPQRFLTPQWADGA